MPKWNGTFYGTISREDILLTDKIGTITIKLIRFKKSEEWCYSKRTRDDFVCFYDEVKPYFGLVKQGTHMIDIDGTRYLICKYRELNKVKISEYKYYKKHISKILVYKRMLSVSESLKDIYILGKKVLDLSFGKTIVKNNMRDNFIDRFFPKYNDFNRCLFKSMLRKKYEDKMICFSEVMSDLEIITKDIKYSNIGCEDISQFLFDKWN